MAAEIWDSRVHRLVQYLLVGVAPVSRAKSATPRSSTRSTTTRSLCEWQFALSGDYPVALPSLPRTMTPNLKSSDGHFNS